MLKWLIQGVFFAITVSQVSAIPNTIIGNINQVNSPLDGQDITGRMLATGLWNGAGDLPGEWEQETMVADARISHLLARPIMFGEDVILLRSVHRGNSLESLVVTFADAGSYFEYQPAGKGGAGGVAAHRQELAEKQREFAELYQERHERIKRRLTEMSSKRVKSVKQGAARTLRAELDVFQMGDLKFGLLADGKRIIRLTISREIPHVKSWLDHSILKLNASSRRQHFRSHVTVKENGDHLITGVPVVPQGYRPYCGINTLVMVANYYGLHLDEDWLAVAGKFQNTGSVGNSNMLGLYNAVAKEARLKISRETKFHYPKARALLKEGMPVIVWRKFDYGRNRLHYKFSQKLAKDPTAKLPEPNTADRATWPGKSHPVHASVIVGFNDKRKEVLFLESWEGVTIPGRMRYEEMEATSTWAFYFRNQ